MKISELQSFLSKAQNKYGNIEILIRNYEVLGTIDTILEPQDLEIQNNVLYIG